MSRTNWGLVLLLMLIVSLISTAPARIVALLLPSNKIIIQGFSGTLWRGRASRGLIAVGPGFVHLGRIRWSVNPLSLLLFSPRLTVNAEWGNQRIDGQVTFGGSSEFGFEDFSANMSAQLVRQFAPLNVAGDLSVHLDELQIKAGIPSAGSGRVVWRD
ncbi:MAG: type II secretion system protein GspN, partial [Halieaceae bacterium]|nr:type II secretion system protein GspN [Halieaceae bacterium]